MVTCKECSDNALTKKVMQLSIAVILICWCVWLLIDDMTNLKSELATVKRNVNYSLDYVSLLKEREYEASHKKDVELDG